MLVTRLLARLGLTETSFLLIPACLIGVIAAGAAVAFHELINHIRDWLYGAVSPEQLYGSSLWLIVLWPALGGLVVGLFTLVFGAGGHGVPEVIESVVRRQGFIRARVMLEKILTAGATIGSGGSAGAEGPIIQIGAAIASLVGRMFRISRHHMPILIGCGSAAGISAIFNSPIGGVLFTLEVILQDFSIRAFTPLVLSSVIANVTTQAIYRSYIGDSYEAIFKMPALTGDGLSLTWVQLPSFLLLGVLCGVAAVTLTGLMQFTEKQSRKLKVPEFTKPAVGGAAVGLLGVVYVMALGWWLIGQAKPISFYQYPMPGFFGDGYGVIRQMLTTTFYASHSPAQLWALVGALLVAKLLATCLTLGTGGSGGVIAPSLFLGSTVGGLLGLALLKLHYLGPIDPAMYALIGMGAVLAAVVHAPLAAILILLELTREYQIVMPAMLATITATGMARLIFPESIYTIALRKRGIRLGHLSDNSLLHRLSVEEIGLDPAMTIPARTPMPVVITRMAEQDGDAIVVDSRGNYLGMLTHHELELAVIQPESLSLLVAGEVARREVPVLHHTDDLARAMEIFSEHDISGLAVTVAGGSGKVIGILTRARLMQRYHSALVNG